MPRKHRIDKKIAGRKRYEHRAQTLVSVSLLIILLAFPLSMFKAVTPPFIQSPQSMDEAQVARNYARGDGLCTNIIRPHLYTHLPRFAKPLDIVNPFLHIWLLGHLPGITKGSVLNPPSATVTECSTFFYLLTGAMLFYILRSVCDIRTAVAASLIILCNVPFLSSAVSGTRDTMTAFFLVIFLVLVYLDRNASVLLSFLVGASLGFCYLAEYSLILMVIPLAVSKATRPRGDAFRHLIAAGVGLVAVVMPWMLHNYRAGGNPLCGQSFAAAIQSAPDLGATPPPATGDKLYLLLSKLYGRMIIGCMGTVALAFFLISPLVQFENQNLQRVKLFIWSSFMIVAPAGLILGGYVNAMTAFMPVVLAVGTKTFIDLLPRQTIETAPRRLKMTMLFVVINLAAYALSLSNPAKGRREAATFGNYLKNMADMRSVMHSGDIIMTNAEEWLAYYGEFNTLPLPAKAAELSKWEESFGKLSFAVVCPYGKVTPLSKMILGQRCVPEWFITDKAMIYPANEVFFSGEEGRVPLEKSDQSQ